MEAPVISFSWEINPFRMSEFISHKIQISFSANPPSGCYFHARCSYCTEKCKTEVPELHEVDGRMVACHRAEELHLRGFDYSTVE